VESARAGSRAAPGAAPSVATNPLAAHTPIRSSINLIASRNAASDGGSGRCGKAAPGSGSPSEDEGGSDPETTDTTVGSTGAAAGKRAGASTVVSVGGAAGGSAGGGALEAASCAGAAGG
jgi:hypothetical protein